MQWCFLSIDMIERGIHTRLVLTYSKFTSPLMLQYLPTCFYSPPCATDQKGETLQIAGQVFWWSLEHILLNWLLFWLKDKGHHIHCKSMPGIWQKGNASLAKEHHYTREHNTKWASVYSPLQTLGRNYNATDIVISKKERHVKNTFF